jgi:hypothetical protein
MALALALVLVLVRATMAGTSLCDDEPSPVCVLFVLRILFTEDT